MDEPDFLRRVRGWLGSVTSSDEEIERIVTEASVDWAGRDLDDHADQLAFVDGPLAGSISRTLPPPAALKALRTIGSAVALSSAKSDRSTPVYAVDDRITGQIPALMGNRVSVLVIAQSDATANRLSVLLGEDRARVEHATDKLTVVAGLAEHPLVIVIDATDPTALSADQLLSFVDRALPHAFWVVWGEGRELATALEGRLRRLSTPSLLLSERDGLGPILDVVLSRRPG